MKKKIVAMCLVVALAVVAIGGATLAYFTDTDSKTNTFTTAKVDITLVEDFQQDSKLMPGTSKDGNAVAKVVTVKNESDSENSYVRVHIAVPSALVDQNLNSYNDMLHWNFKAQDWAPSGWSLKPTYTENDNGWTDNGWDNQNAYNTTINGVQYTVWVVTYRSVLEPGATTAGAAMTQMYLDWRVETADGQTYTKANYDANGNKLEGTMSYTLPKDGKIPVLVVAEGTQAAGFSNAYEALNAAFGVPSATNNPWYVAPTTPEVGE